MWLFSSTYTAPKHELGMSHLEESGQLLLTVRDFRVQLILQDFQHKSPCFVSQLTEERIQFTISNITKGPTA
jgi:hypothetical protein